MDPLNPLINLSILLLVTNEQFFCYWKNGIEEGWTREFRIHITCSCNSWPTVTRSLDGLATWAVTTMYVEEDAPAFDPRDALGCTRGTIVSQVTGSSWDLIHARLGSLYGGSAHTSMGHTTIQWILHFPLLLHAMLNISRPSIVPLRNYTFNFVQNTLRWLKNRGRIFCEKQY